MDDEKMIILHEELLKHYELFGCDGLRPSEIDPVKAMASELLQLREQTRWVPVSERLPEYTDEYNVTCQVSTPSGCFITVRTYRFVRCEGREPTWTIPNDIMESATITHWRPLPAPPAQEVE